MRFDLLDQGPAETERKLVGFLIGDVQYGIDIMTVREIVNPLELIQIPGAPSFMVGVSDHREAVIPIVSLRLRFGLEDATELKRIKWILLKTHGKNVGIVVDRATKVVGVTNAKRKKQHPLLAYGEKTWIKHVFDIDDGLIFELDPDAIIGSAAEFVESDMAGSDYFDE